MFRRPETKLWQGCECIANGHRRRGADICRADGGDRCGCLKIGPRDERTSDGNDFCARGRTILLSVGETGCSIIAPSLAHAQENSTSAGTEIVTVTGSLISRPDFQTPTPVTAVSAADISTTAPVTVGDALAALPQFGLGTSEHGGFVGPGGGASYLNLRNLGS